MEKIGARVHLELRVEAVVGRRHLLDHLLESRRLGVVVYLDAVSLFFGLEISCKEST